MWQKILKNLGLIPLSQIERLTPVEQKVVKDVRAFSMLSADRLANLLVLAQEIEARKLSGDMIECGSCRGGSGAVLAYVVKKARWKRKIWLLDSFAGHPKPKKRRGVDTKLMKEWAGTMVASKQDVVKALKTVDSYEPAKVKIVGGWFQESVPKLKLKELSLVHIDADWYESTVYCLNELFDKLVPRGFVVVDDYAGGDFPGVAQAVNEFFAKRQRQIAEKFVVPPALVIRKQ